MLNRFNAARRVCNSLSLQIPGMVVLVMALTAPGFAAQSSLEDVRFLLHKGKVQSSLNTLRQLPTAQRLSKEGRLLRGVLLSKLGKLEEATQVFQKLNSDYPDSPEPLNNLAVLYAGQGLLEQARNSLLRAIELHPDHANARRNLGDLYLHLAMSSYQHAQKLEKGNRVVARKIEQLQVMLGQRSPAAADAQVSSRATPRSRSKPAARTKARATNRTPVVPAGKSRSVPNKTSYRAGNAAGKKSPPTSTTRARVSTNITMPAGRCLLLGPFKTRAGLAELKKWMAGNGQRVEAMTRSREQRIWQVYYPPLDSAAMAKQRLKELKATGIDGFVVRSGQIKNALSLGAFQALDGATRMITRLKKKGIEARYREQHPLRKRHWLRWTEVSEVSAFAARLHQRFAHIPWPPEGC